MKRFLLYAGLVGALGLSQIGPAKADAYVDTPSFGRIVYGVTGGAVVLPQDAWEGYYVTGAANAITPASDQTFSDPGGSKYLGDDPILGGTSAWLDLGTNTILKTGGIDITGSINATQYYDDNTAWSITGGKAKDLLVATKLAYVSSYGLGATVSVKDISGTQVLLSAGPVPVTSAVVSVWDPFTLQYTTQTTSGPTTYSSDVLAPANRFKAFQATSGTWAGWWFIGCEDWNSTEKRWDWNDTVFMMDVTAVPEPAFFQMSGLLTLGAFGLLRLRRRSA